MNGPPDYSAQVYKVRSRERQVGGVIHLDGCWFTDCCFRNATLVFEGLKPFGHANSQFPGCRIEFRGAALMVLDRTFALLPDLVTVEDLRSTLLSLAAGQVTLN